MSIQAFLDFWELKKNKLSIVAPESKNAVRIMTIHKAKGLEFPVVIFPYNLNIYNQIKPKTWFPYEQSNTINSVLIDYGKKLNYLNEEGIAIYNQQREELELDNFNILYVGLTRAVEQLYIISEKVITIKNEENLNFTSGLFINYLKQQRLWDDAKNEYNFGNPKRINFKEKEESSSTFQKRFISNSWKNHNISIVTSSSILWDTEQGKSILYGNLFHEILSKIKTKTDVDEVINQYVFSGIISNEEQLEITEILNRILNHKELSVFFNQNNQVYLEQQIITSDRNIIIPDRIVIIDGKTTIIDYKTGKPDAKYHQQLNNYAQVLEELNFKLDKKLLVYINEEIIVEEV